MFRGFFSALLPCRGWHVPRRRHPSPVPDILLPFRTSFSRSAYITDVIFFILCPIPIVANSALVKILPPQQCDRRGRRAGSPPRSRCRVSCWGPMRGLLSGASAVCPSDALCRVSFWEPMFGLRPVTYAGSPSGEARQALRQGADEGCPFGGLCRVSGCR